MLAHVSRKATHFEQAQRCPLTGAHWLGTDIRSLLQQYIGVRGSHAHEQQKGPVRAIVEGDLFLWARSSFFFLLSSSYFLLPSSFFLLPSSYFLFISPRIVLKNKDLCVGKGDVSGEGRRERGGEGRAATQKGSFSGFTNSSFTTKLIFKKNQVFLCDLEK